MTVQRHPRPRVDQSGHGDVHHEGAAHPPQDVEAHQPGDRHHRDYDHVAEYRLQLISTFPQYDFFILPVTNPDGYEYSHTTDRVDTFIFIAFVIV